jgi:cytochrome P450
MGKDQFFVRYYIVQINWPDHAASFQRKVLQTFTLSDGQVIPAGIAIEVPAVAVSFDPELFPQPEKFDPLRFYKLRQQAREGGGSGESAALNQFVSVSQNGLTFGYGLHACPGRFFVANELKLILSNMLLKYDFKLADSATERYPNMEFAHMVSLIGTSQLWIIQVSRIFQLILRCSLFLTHPRN